MAPLGLRERKKADTRTAISRAALFMAVEHGPDAVTVDAIAEAAGVSPRTVFNYFASKEQAILGFNSDRSTELKLTILERPAREAPLTVLRNAFLEIVADNPDVAEIARARAQLVRDYPQLHPSHVAGYTNLEDALVDAIAQRTGLDAGMSPYPRLVVSSAIAAFRIALERAGQGKPALVAAIDEAFDSLANGLKPPR